MKPTKEGLKRWIAKVIEAEAIDLHALEDLTLDEKYAHEKFMFVAGEIYLMVDSEHHSYEDCHNLFTRALSEYFKAFKPLSLAY